MKNNHHPEIRFKEFNDSWKKMKLENVTSKIGSGKTPRGGDKTYVSNGVPLLRSQNIYNDRVNLDNIAFIPANIDEEMSNSRVQKDDVLLNITGASIGRSAVYNLNYNANVNQHVSIIRPNKEIDSYFLQFNITSEKGQKQIDLNQAGGGREGLNFKQIAQMNFYFPSKYEQEKISKYLKDLDKTIYFHQQELDTLKQTKQGFLQKMFPKEGETVPEVRFPGFQKEWRQVYLHDISKLITKGTTPKSQKRDGEVNYIKVENINNQTSEISIATRISMQEHEGYLKRSQLEKGDILFSIAGTLGRTAIVNEEILPANINQALAIIRLNEGDIYFISTYLKGKAVALYIMRNPTVGAQPNLSLIQVGNLVINLPEIREQIKIGEFFKKLDKTIELHEKELEALKQTKKAFLQKMFV